MLAKKTVKNQITLPKKVAAMFPDVVYFDVHVHEGHIILKPVVTDRIERVREKLAGLGISDNDIQEAVAWSRENSS